MYKLEIAQESFISSLKMQLKKFLLTIIKYIEKLFQKIKNQKIRKFLLSKTKRLKEMLGEVDEITPENVEEASTNIKEEANKIKEEVDKVVGEDEAFTELDKHEIENDDMVTIIRNSKASRNCYFFKVKINSPERYLEMYGLLESACKASTFNEYIKYWKEFKRSIKLPEKCIVYAMQCSCKSASTFEMYYILEDKRYMKKNIKDPLYHTSKNPNLVAITPRWRAENDCYEEDPIYSGRFFDTPRAFFGTYPMSRMGGHVDKSRDDLFIYKVEGIKQAYIDIDGITYGKSVYVEGSAPIKLTKVVDNDTSSNIVDENNIPAKFKNVPKDILGIVINKDTTGAKKYILDTLDSIDTDPSKRKENTIKWKEFSKRIKSMRSLFGSEFSKIFDKAGSVHGVHTTGVVLREDFQRYTALLKHTFGEGEFKTVATIGNNIFVFNKDMDRVETTGDEDDDLY